MESTSLIEVRLTISSIVLLSFAKVRLVHDPHFRNEFSPEFEFMLDKMKEFDWLYQYQYMRGLSSACSGLSRRISFENNLHQAPHVFAMLQPEIEGAFRKYMETAQPFFEDYFKKN